MNKSENISSLTRRYLSGELSEAAFETLKRQMEEEEFGDKIAAEMIKDYGRIQLKEKLRALEEAETPYALNQNKVLKLSNLAALILILILPLGYLMIRKPAALTPQDSFSQFYDPYLMNEKMRGNALRDGHPTRDGDSTVNTHSLLLDSATVLYVNKRFEEAIQIFEELKLDSNRRVQAQADLFLGNIYLMANPPESSKAITHLLEVIHNDDSEKKDHAYWYLALAYVYEKDFEKAKENLSKYMGYYGEESERGKKAMELLALIASFETNN